MTAAEKVLAALKKLDTDANARSICSQVDHTAGLSISDVDKVLLPLFKSWPEGSGCVAYPVEGDCAEHFTDGKWDTETERGRRRHRLLAYLIERLETGA